MTELRLSLPPERLSIAAAREYGIELKFDWEHRDVLTGETNLGDVLADAGIDPGRVGSVHLPPGTERRGDRIGMAVTSSTRSAIVDFVYEQLEVVPDATIVAHPPKRFQYAELLGVIEGLLTATGREFAIENAAVESNWYRPEELAFFAVAADEEPTLDGLRLTVDSAHLPAPRSGGRSLESNRNSLEPDPDAIETLASRLREEGYALPNAYRERVVDRSPPEDPLTALDRADPYAPLVRTLWLCGDRVRIVHLNDPVTDGVPEVDQHGGSDRHSQYGDRTGRDAVFEFIRGRDLALTLEPGDLLHSPTDLHRRFDALESLLRG